MLDLGAGDASDVTIGQLRRELEPFVARPLRSALRHVTQNLVLYGLVMWGTLTAGTWWTQLVGGVALGAIVSNCFLIAHDASHGSFTGSKALNRHIARITFLVGLHPASAWAYSHNRIHHGFTNLKGTDFVWLPLTKAEYDARRWLGRLHERMIRHTAGFGLGYAAQVWWNHLMAPRADNPTRWSLVHMFDRALVVLLATALTATALRNGGGPWLVFCVVVLPFALLTWTIGFVVYFNHTHPDVPWFAEREAWSHVSGQVDGTVHVAFEGRAGSLLGNIMNHAAHHVHPGVPLANLDAAQDRLDEVLGRRARCDVWSWAVHAHIVRTCKLYDYERMQWTDFSGRPTSRALAPSSELAEPLLEPAHP